MNKQKFPKGWDQKRVEDLLAHQASLTEEEQVAEDEAAIEQKDRTMVSVPNRLLPAVRKLLLESAS